MAVQGVQTAIGADHGCSLALPGRELELEVEGAGETRGGAASVGDSGISRKSRETVCASWCCPERSAGDGTTCGWGFSDVCCLYAKLYTDDDDADGL